MVVHGVRQKIVRKLFALMSSCQCPWTVREIYSHLLRLLIGIRRSDHNRLRLIGLTSVNLRFADFPTIDERSLKTAALGRINFCSGKVWSSKSTSATSRFTRHYGLPTRFRIRSPGARCRPADSERHTIRLPKGSCPAFDTAPLPRDASAKYPRHQPDPRYCGRL